MEMPDDYNAHVGRRGLPLSGGECQRIAIVLLLLRTPKIILLDEVTSALDNDTEREVQRALSDVCEGHIPAFIAHRLSTITGANLFFVIEKSTIIQSGTHLELIQQPGKYASMWEEQLRADKSHRIECR